MAEERKTLEQVAEEPRSAEVDGQKVQKHSLQERIALDRYLASKEAASKGLGIRITKMAAGGGA